MASIALQDLSRAFIGRPRVSAQGNIAAAELAALRAPEAGVAPLEWAEHVEPLSLTSARGDELRLPRRRPIAPEASLQAAARLLRATPPFPDAEPMLAARVQTLLETLEAITLAARPARSAGPRVI